MIMQVLSVGVNAVLFFVVKKHLIFKGVTNFQQEVIGLTLIWIGQFTIGLLQQGHLFFCLSPGKRGRIGMILFG